MTEIITGQKFDDSKTRFELIPPSALEDVAAVYTYGARKYDDFNWMKGLLYTRLFGAALRHLWAWYRGCDLDPETGISHLAHAACNLFMLLHYQKLPSAYSLFDNRPFKEPSHDA